MKNNALRVVNLLLYLTGCGMAGTGFLLAWRLPPGSRGGRGLSLYGLDRHVWGDIHLYLAYAVIALTILHLVFNRVWLEKIASLRKRWPLAAGLAAGLAIISFFLLVPIEKPQPGEGRHGAGRMQAGE